MRCFGSVFLILQVLSYSNFKRDSAEILLNFIKAYYGFWKHIAFALPSVDHVPQVQVMTARLPDDFLLNTSATTLALPG